MAPEGAIHWHSRVQPMALFAHCHANCFTVRSWSRKKRNRTEGLASVFIRLPKPTCREQSAEMKISEGMVGMIQSDELHGRTMFARAQRFPIHATMLYRIHGERDWYPGTVENISSSGLLFHADHLLEINSSIEVNVSLTGILAGGHGGRIVGRGKIVRLSPCMVQPGCTMIAATLYHSRILRD